MNKYDKKLKKTLLAELKTGVSVIELSNKYDISRNTIYRWKKEVENRVLSPEFLICSQEWLSGIESANEIVRDS